MYFSMKSYLKSNRNHAAKHAFRLTRSMPVMCKTWGVCLILQWFCGFRFIFLEQWKRREKLASLEKQIPIK
jgi:hypothetical protein